MGNPTKKGRGHTHSKIRTKISQKKADFKNSNSDLTQSVKSAESGTKPAPESGTELPVAPEDNMGPVRDRSGPSANLSKIFAKLRLKNSI